MFDDRRKTLVGPGARVVVGACLLAVPCGCDLVSLEEIDDLASVEEMGASGHALLGGTYTTEATHRREIGKFTGCNGTLIGDRWVLSAAHCVWGWLPQTNNPDLIYSNDWTDIIDTPAVIGFLFSTSTNGSTWSALNCSPSGPTTCEIERVFTFNTDTRLGANDLALVRLANPINSSFATPTTIATSVSTSTVTAWGSGPNSGSSGAGPMQWRDYTYGITTDFIRPGDSGGPRTLGPRSSLGAIWAVNSGYGAGGDVLGNPISRRSQILDVIGEWNTWASYDISRNGWCTHSTAELLWGDVDADGDPDAICHDTSTGWIWVAENRRRLIREQFVTTSGFCSGSGKVLYTGDFNGDGRTDLLCRSSSGLIEIDYASTSASSRYRSGSVSSLGTKWCTHSTARLHIADVNGDGRSDLLCHDVSSGVVWVDFANSAATGQFSGTSDWWNYNGNWCSHGGARMYVGDFNGDQRTDLLCHTQTTGFLHLMYASTSAPWYDLTADEALASGQDTMVPCTGTGQGTCADEGQVCESGTCRERLCANGNGTLTVADYSGDGISDVMCFYPNSRTFGIRSYAGLKVAGRSALYDTGGYLFGWRGRVRMRNLRAASQPWSLGM